MQQAYEMAVDALGLAISSRMEEGEEVPSASEADQVEVSSGVLVIVEFDLEAYNRKYNSRAVKKTLSIPEWLNEAASKAGVNFSQVLQEALIEKVR